MVCFHIFLENSMSVTGNIYAHIGCICQTHMQSVGGITNFPALSLVSISLHAFIMLCHILRYLGDIFQEPSDLHKFR
jgi:hypothetical protein